MPKKLELFNLAILFKMEANLTYICGKWFNSEHKEVKNDNMEYIYQILKGEVEVSEELKLQCLDIINLTKTQRDDFLTHLKNISKPLDRNLWYNLPIVDKVLEKVSNNDNDFTSTNLTHLQKLIIKELLFHYDNEYMFIIFGKGGSGKSTFLNLIKQLFNNDVSSVMVQQLGDQHNRYEAVKHRLLCSDELGSEEISNPFVKSIVSHQAVLCRPLYAQPEEMIPQCKLIYSCNIPPSLNISDTGILRRIKYYEMDNVIKNPDPTLNHKIFSEEELLNIAMECYFEEGDISELDFDTHKAIMLNNSVRKWTDRFRLNGNKVPLENCKNYYQFYREYCLENGFKPFNVDNFNNIIDLIIEWNEKDSKKMLSMLPF